MTIFPTKSSSSSATTRPSTGSDRPIFRAIERSEYGSGTVGPGSVAAEDFVVDWQLGTPVGAGAKGG